MNREGVLPIWTRIDMAMPQRKALQRSTPDETLRNGDRMMQPEFHKAYEAMPATYRAELIAGIVYEPSPLGYSHGSNDARLIYLLEHYSGQTRGLGTACGATVILSEEDEVQPDVLLRIMPEFGGQSRDTKKKPRKPYYVV